MNLKKYRKQKGLTQAQVAKMCGIGQVVYSNYEIGKRNPKPKMLMKLARALNCSVDELIADEGDEDEYNKNRGQVLLSKNDESADAPAAGG